MIARIEKFFSPVLRLREIHGTLAPDYAADRPLFNQFRQAAGIHGRCTMRDYDALLRAAGEHGYCLAVISGGLLRQAAL